MNVFENEGNVSQDANFRAHLDSNWDSGNREFDKVEGLLGTLKETINGYQEEFDQLKQNAENRASQPAPTSTGSPTGRLRRADGLQHRPR